MRLVINIIRLWNLGSASGVTWRTVDVLGQIGTRLVINIICLWNLGSTSGVTWRTVDVCGQIGTRLVIDCIYLRDLGSNSGLTWRIVDICMVKFGWDLVEFGQRLWCYLTNCWCSWSVWLGYGQTMVIMCERLKTWLVLRNFLRDLPGVCILLGMVFLARHNCHWWSKPSTKLGRTSIETLINYNATTLPLSSTLRDKVVFLQNRLRAWLISFSNAKLDSIQKSKHWFNNRMTIDPQ